MECYLIPAVPQPILLPVECVAEVVEKPEITKLDEARANWMRGHFTWRNQRLPVMSYSALHDAGLDESKKRKSNVVVLNPVPDAVRKAYSGVVCYGDVKTVTVDDSLTEVDFPDRVDRRYAELAVEVNGKPALIPRLAALAVAFSYF